MVRVKVDDPALEHAINESRELYAAGNVKFFDYMRDDVRVYNLNSVEPMIGRDTFEKEFMPNFRRKVDTKVVASDVRKFEQQAVHAQTVEFTLENLTLITRQTVVWELTDGEWKVGHIHITQVGSPITTARERPKSAKAVKVLNERIATVAAAVGVAQ
jgi:hypothetical protein